MTGPERAPSPDGPAADAIRSDAVDELVERIVAEETAELRRGFDAGAEFAVTRAAATRDGMLHRLECASIEAHLDRRSKWTDPHRRRLAADPGYRMPLPALITRTAARNLSGVRSCKLCWPNASGTEPRPLRHLSARSLGPQHVGHVLAREDGAPLGTIVRWGARTGTDLFGVVHDEIEVVTSTGLVTVAPDEQLTIWDLPTDEETIRRKAQLMQRFASGDVSPIH
ncbi:hypothetical protein [Agromyces sp. SYSU T0242]|uniref:hypothetical protein n=1 Tax=Agromyces litoreus TaxID=3158561 RepID=UPI003392C7C1